MKAKQSSISQVNNCAAVVTTCRRAAKYVTWLKQTGQQTQQTQRPTRSAAVGRVRGAGPEQPGESL